MEQDPLEELYGEAIRGRVRVGRCDYRRGCHYAEVPGFTAVLCISKDPVYSALSPFVLRDSDGVLVENRWQFSKIYRKVPEVKQKNWYHWSETHIDDKGEPNRAYWAWRSKGFVHRKPVRFPVGRENRKTCVGAIADDDEKKARFLNYVESRKKIYVLRYTAALKLSPVYQGLKRRLLNGENLLIIDIDGPHKAAMPYTRKNMTYLTISSTRWALLKQTKKTCSCCSTTKGIHSAIGTASLQLCWTLHFDRAFRKILKLFHLCPFSLQKISLSKVLSEYYRAAR